jgi:hypothetical protein
VAGSASGGRGRGLALALAAGVAALGWTMAPVAGAAPPGALLFPCEPARIEAGDPAAASLLAEGFHPVEHRERSFAWTTGRARIDLPLAAGGRRTVRLTVLSAFARQRLGLRWNGADLGARERGPGWNTPEWVAPDGVPRAGYNRLELVPAKAGRVPPDPRRLAVAVERVEIEPAAPCTGWAPVGEGGRGSGERQEEPGSAEAAAAQRPLRAAEPAGPGGVAGAVPGRAPVRDRPAPRIVDPDGEIDLPPGGILLVPTVWPPEARVGFRATAAPGARLRLFAWVGDAYRELPVPPLDDVSRPPSSGNDPTEGLEPASAIAGERAPEPHPAGPAAGSAGRPAGPVASPVEIAAGLRGAGGLAAVAEGGGVGLSGLEVTGDDRGWAWRRACRLPWLEAALLALLIAVLLAARTVLRRWPELAETASRWTPSRT